VCLNLYFSISKGRSSNLLLFVYGSSFLPFYIFIPTLGRAVVYLGPFRTRTVAHYRG